jgi:hypothetical protein
MAQNNNSGSMWPVIFGILVIATIIQMLVGNSSSSSTSSTSSSSSYSPSGVDRTSFEHRYAKERVKLEGYSDREATQAADAIIKFQNAQRNR